MRRRIEKMFWGRTRDENDDDDDDGWIGEEMKRNKIVRKRKMGGKTVAKKWAGQNDGREVGASGKSVLIREKGVRNSCDEIVWGLGDVRASDVRARGDLRRALISPNGDQFDA
ncbi:hypothetical protein niasHS_018142 [Heterodera schachtii]|uniref:Uncharacterized protein n=1 Tax=Heterodera schachtii TaxID=97005 RepID=A0ABD2HSH4_HETSC